MPADAGRPIDQAPEGGHVADTAEPLEEGKSAAADAGLVERQQIGVRHRAVDVGDAAVFSVALRDRVGHDAIVEPVQRRVDDHGALDADFFVQGAKHRQRRVRRRVGAGRRERIFGGGTENVGVGIDRTRRRLERRGFGIGDPVPR